MNGKDDEGQGRLQEWENNKRKKAADRVSEPRPSREPKGKESSHVFFGMMS